MPKICYTEKNFGPERMAIIDKANKIIADYKQQGFELTLRQLYYQFVSRDLFPESWADKVTGSTNNERSYKRLGDAINDGRIAGVIDWDAIVDRTRNLQSMSHWNSPQEIIGAVAKQYHIDMWEGQEWRPEVWIEKDALVGVIEGACRRNDVAYFSCRGYTSQSELWAAGMRMRGYLDDGQRPVILHLGDHDPSGIDMTRDVTDRLELFAGEKIKVIRLALNMDQVKKFRPPPNPCKITDSRAEGYIAAHGAKSWELDALDPKVVDTLIEEHISGHRDDELWERAVGRKGKERGQLQTLSTNWEKIVKYLK